MFLNAKRPSAISSAHCPFYTGPDRIKSIQCRCLHTTLIYPSVYVGYTHTHEPDWYGTVDSFQIENKDKNPSLHFLYSDAIRQYRCFDPPNQKPPPPVFPFLSILSVYGKTFFVKIIKWWQKESLKDSQNPTWFLAKKASFEIYRPLISKKPFLLAKILKIKKNRFVFFFFCKKEKLVKNWPNYSLSSISPQQNPRSCNQ